MTKNLQLANYTTLKCAIPRTAAKTRSQDPQPKPPAKTRNHDPQLPRSEPRPAAKTWLESPQKNHVYYCLDSLGCPVGPSIFVAFVFGQSPSATRLSGNFALMRIENSSRFGILAQTLKANDKIELIECSPVLQWPHHSSINYAA